MRKALVTILAVVGASTIALALRRRRHRRLRRQGQRAQADGARAGPRAGPGRGRRPRPVRRISAARQPTVRDVVDALERARRRPARVGLVARLGAAPIGVAEIQEIRDAVKAFRAKKKFAVAYAETFGEFAPGNGAYYLATAFDEIWLQPSGDVGLNGLVAESPFLARHPRQARRQARVRPAARVQERDEHVHGDEVHRRPPGGDRRSCSSRSTGRWCRGSPRARKLTEAEVRALVDRGPLPRPGGARGQARRRPRLPRRGPREADGEGRRRTRSSSASGRT